VTIEQVLVNTIKKKYPYKDVTVGKVFKTHGVYWELWVPGVVIEYFNDMDALVSFVAKMVGGMENILIVKPKREQQS